MFDTRIAAATLALAERGAWIAAAMFAVAVFGVEPAAATGKYPGRGLNIRHGTLCKSCNSARVFLTFHALAKTTAPFSALLPEAMPICNSSVVLFVPMFAAPVETTDSDVVLLTPLISSSLLDLLHHEQMMRYQPAVGNAPDRSNLVLFDALSSAGIQIRDPEDALSSHSCVYPSHCPQMIPVGFAPEKYTSTSQVASVAPSIPWCTPKVHDLSACDPENLA